MEESSKFLRIIINSFLGIIINSSLDWSDHISLVNQKVSKSIGILKCANNKLSADTLRSLHFAFVHPYYEYANIVWAVRNTVALQNCSLFRIGQFVSPIHQEMPIYILIHFSEKNTCTSNSGIKLQVACFMFKVDKGLMPYNCFLYKC